MIDRRLDDRQIDIEPIEARRTLAEEVADRLRDLILLDKLGPGQPVRERELSEALGISRTPLREALRVLENEGLVEYSPTRRPYVADPDLNMLAQNLAVLGALEALAGEKACRNATDEEIDVIVGIAREMVVRSELDDPLTFFRRDMSFHHAIVAASGNQPLMQTQQQYNARLWRARFISSRRKPNRPGTLRQHEEIAEALAARDDAACADALRRHLDTTIVNIAQSINDEAQEKKS